MRSTYFELGDVLRIRLSDLPIAREVAQGRHVHVAYAANGTVVELVLLQARAQGWLPLHIKLRLPRPESACTD